MMVFTARQKLGGCTTRESHSVVIYSRASGSHKNHPFRRVFFIFKFARLALRLSLFFVVYNINIEKIKTAKQMERHLKGMANHRRIEILLLVAKNDGITLEGIIEMLDANPKTIGEHARKLHQAGLVNKKYHGKFVEHTLSPYGKIFVNFLKSFQNAK